MIELGTAPNPSAYSCLVYNYYAGVGNASTCAIPAQAASGNNGNVMGYLYQDSVNPSLGHAATYTYDALNRLATATTAAWEYNPFSYDRFGNLLSMNVKSGSAPGLSVGVNGQNQIYGPGYAYDAAGNLTHDGAHSYQWDAEGQLASVDGGSTASITYNALRQTAARTGVGYLIGYAYDASGNPLGTFNAGAGYWWERNVWMGGRLLSFDYGYDASVGTLFIHRNQLGSSTMITNYAASVYSDMLFYPWGQDWVTPSDNWRVYFGSFSRIELDLNAYNTPFRFYQPRIGRWNTPDPADLAAVDITNPQSWNRYAYVGNNPASFVDPLGLDRFLPVYNCDLSGGFPPVLPPIPPIPSGGFPGGGGGAGGGMSGGMSGGGMSGGGTSMGMGGAGGSGGSGVGLPGTGSGPLSGDFGPTGPLSLGDLLGIPGLPTGFGGCDFGVCGTATPDSGFEGATEVGAEVGTFIEPGVGTVVGAVLGFGIDAYLAYKIIHQARGTQGDVGHDYIRDEARQLAKDLGISYCEALQIIYQDARLALDFKKANDAKATQKQDGCRSH